MVMWNFENGRDSGKAVCITGSWEMLGSWVAETLLRRGYIVHITIPLSADKMATLMASPGAEQRLNFIHVDLLDYNSISKAIQGCMGVFHIPAPHDMNGTRDYPSDMIEFEVKGTLNVVEACANARFIKRLVMTSCLSTMIIMGQANENRIFDEKSWTNMDFCREKKLWSPLSKTLMERAAWALAVDKGLDLVVINPATVISKEEIMTEHFKDAQYNNLFALVHIEDLAKAHILALEKPNAIGRYICFEKLVMKDEQNEEFLTFRSSVTSMKKSLSNEKLLTLGMKFRPEGQGM